MPTSDDKQFQELALKLEAVTPEYLEECLETLNNYEEAGIAKPLSTILLEKGYMSLKQISAIHQLQGKKEHIVRGYTILETLGQGGLGIVYKARQDSMGRIVALKVMFPEYTRNAEYLQRFMREARVAAALEHENIVKAIDCGESDGMFFFAMEFVDGRSLKDVILEVKTLPEKEAIEIVLKIAKALKYAEGLNLIHRDIKPDNIMITKTGIPKLCDMGLAKHLESDMSLTNTGLVVGTPFYISPEQAMGDKDLDIRADIYSLGITLYQMITGELPYSGDTAVSIISKHISAAIPSPKEINPELSDELCQIVVKMMAKKRDHRYQTAQELIVDLNRFLRGEELVNPGIDVSHKKSSYHTTDILHQGSNIEEKVIADSSVNATNILPIKEQQIVDQGNTYAQTMDVGNEMQSLAIQQAQQASSSNTEHYGAEISAESAQNPVKESYKLVQELEQKIEETNKAPGKWKFRFFVLIFLLSLGATYKYQDTLRNIWEKLSGKDKIEQDSPNAKPQVYRHGHFAKQQQRYFAAQYQKLQTIHAPKRELPQEMSLLPTGSFRMGSSLGDADESVRHMQMQAFYLDKYEVSNKQYKEFCQATGHSTPGYWQRFAKMSQRRRAAIANYPVVNVSFYDASLYATWRQKRLPTEAEWEYAVKIGKGHEYPWGPKFKRKYANVNTGRLRAVNGFAKGKTEHAIYNTIGNVWEWTNTNYQNNEQLMIIKGGSFAYPPYFARASYRDALFVYGTRNDVGFRCAMTFTKDQKNEAQ